MKKCKTCSGTGKITRFGTDRHDHYQCGTCGGTGYCDASTNRLIPDRPRQPATVEEAARSRYPLPVESTLNLYSYYDVAKAEQAAFQAGYNYAQQPEPMGGRKILDECIKQASSELGVDNYPDCFIGYEPALEFTKRAAEIYARQMIERDRERVKASISTQDTNLLKSKGYQLMRAIDETPIILT